MSRPQVMSDEAMFIITWSDGTEMSKPTYMNGHTAKRLLDDFRVTIKSIHTHGLT